MYSGVEFFLSQSSQSIPAASISCCACFKRDKETLSVRSSASHTRTVLSRDPETILFPNPATEITPLSCPCSTCKHRPFSHTRTVSSEDPETILLSHIATELTSPLCPFNSCKHSPVSSHTRTALKNPETILFPHTATDLTSPLCPFSSCKH